MKMQLRDVPAENHLPMCDTAGTLIRHQSPTQKSFRFPIDEQAWCLWMWMGTERRAVTACHWIMLCTATYHIVLSVPFSFPRALSLSLSISIPLTRSLSRSVVLSLSLFFSLSLLRAVVGLSESLFLSLCLSLYFCLTCSLSFSLDDRTSDCLIFSPTPPPPLSLSLSPTQLWWTLAPYALACDILFNFHGLWIGSSVCCDILV